MEPRHGGGVSQRCLQEPRGAGENGVLHQKLCHKAHHPLCRCSLLIAHDG